MSGSKLIKTLNHGARCVPWFTLLLTGGMVVLFVLGSSCFDLLIYDRSRIMQGEWWRLLSGHFVHLGVDHLKWDLFAFFILASVLELVDRARMIILLMLSCVGVSGWLFLSEPTIGQYYGLSGALNGLIVVASVYQWRETKNMFFLLVIGGTILKMMYELITHRPLFIDPTTATVPISHVAGFVTGVIYLLYIKLIKSFVKQAKNALIININ